MCRKTQNTMFYIWLFSGIEMTFTGKEKPFKHRIFVFIYAWKIWYNLNEILLLLDSIIWKSDLTDKMKHSFFQAAVTSILLYGCTTWILTKRLEKKLDSNYTRMLRGILNKSWRQYSTRHQLYGHLPPITKAIQVRRTRHAGHCWRSRDELIKDVLLWKPHTWPCKSRTTSTNIHSAAMWGYGMLSWRPA